MYHSSGPNTVSNFGGGLILKKKVLYLSYLCQNSVLRTLWNFMMGQIFWPKCSVVHINLDCKSVEIILSSKIEFKSLKNLPKRLNMLTQKVSLWKKVNSFTHIFTGFLETIFYRWMIEVEVSSFLKWQPFNFPEMVFCLFLVK